MGRTLIAVAAGLVLAIAIIFAFESLSHYYYPLPRGFNSEDTALLREAMYNAPIEMYLVVLVGYVLASFSGGFLASFISRRHHVRNALVVGFFLLMSGIANMLMMPHAPWFWLSVLVYVPFAWLGGMAGRKLDREPMTAAEESLI